MPVRGILNRSVMPDIIDTLVAVDIGNSRIKLGRFDPASARASADAARPLPIAAPLLPDPTETLDLPLSDSEGNFNASLLAAWCRDFIGARAEWRVASVHRGATEQFARAVDESADNSSSDWPLQRLTYRDIPLTIDVDEPSRVGVDRLLAATAANRIRCRDRAAIVVDSGSATTIDLVSAAGAFCGGAILPGIAMAARALDEQTDALPLVTTIDPSRPPAPLGKSTVAAIESGLFWGAVGSIRELVRQLAAGLDTTPEVFFTGGASPRIATLLAESETWSVRHVPHLVLSGIAVIDRGK